MYNSRFSKILILSSISVFFLAGFKEKFLEKNQSGSPNSTSDSREQVTEPIYPEAEDEFDLTMEIGPRSEDRKKFDLWYLALQNSVRSEINLNEKLEILNRGLAKLESDREQLQNLKFNEEIEIDFLIKPLKILPKSGKFKRQECRYYKLSILSHFDPTTEDEVKDPSLRKAIDMLDILCSE